MTGNDKLLELASLLEGRATLSTSIPLKEYSQLNFYHPCGSPACALGLWGFMHPETWVIKRGRVQVYPTKKVYEYETREPAISSAMEEFEITREEYFKLFSYMGCGQVGHKQITELEAAAFIRNFVSKRTKTKAKAVEIA